VYIHDLTLQRSFASRRILITGASGFIGSQVATLGQKLGAELHILSSRQGENPGARLWRTDLGDESAVKKVVAEIRPDGVIHLAAAGVRYASGSLAGLLRTNVSGLDNLLRAVAELEHLTPVVIAGSCSEYAAQKRPITEDDPVGPLTAYGVSKASATLTAHLFSDRIPITILRPFNIYGPNELSPRLLPYIVERTLCGEPIDLTGGEQIRDYSFVTDVAGAFWLALATTPLRAGFEMLNYGSGEAITVRSFVNSIVAQLEESGYRPDIRFGSRPYRSDEAMVCVPNVTRMRAALGVTAVTPLESGVRQSLISIPRKTLRL
jgi:UDP-glucose 4-epimerase